MVGFNQQGKESLRLTFPDFSDVQVIAMQLAKIGYYGGNVETILNLDYDLVTDILTFENGLRQQEELNFSLSKK